MVKPESKVCCTSNLENPKEVDFVRSDFLICGILVFIACLNPKNLLMLWEVKDFSVIMRT